MNKFSPEPIFSAVQKRILLTAAVILIFVLLSIILQELASILKPFFVAIFLVLMLQPVVVFLKSTGIPGFLAYFLVSVTFILVLYLFGFFIYQNIDNFTRNSLLYEGKVNQLISGLLIRAGVIRESAEFKLRDLKFLQWLPSGSLTAFFRSSLGSFFDLIGNVSIIMFFMIFIIAEWHNFQTRIEKAYGEKRSQQILQVMENINTSVHKYIFVKTIMSLGTGILSATVMAIFGLEFWLIFGVFTFLINFIPYLGSIIATIIPTIIAFLQFSSPWVAVWLAVCLILIQTIIGNLLEPRFHGQKLNLSPLIVLFSIMFWGWLWGGIGMILAVPIIATLRIVLEHIDSTRPLALLISQIK
ncbi:AI-2E family transporter [bacterium]|nr:AI-2E family transporter [bacterium]